MAYLYRHIRLDKNQPFYVGIGSDSHFKRANGKTERSQFWRSIVTKAPYRVDIVMDDLSWEEACQKEIEFIKLYGRRDLSTGCLCNMTDGGEGAFGRSLSVETKAKIADSVKRNTHWKNGRKHTQEALDKIGAASAKQALEMTLEKRLQKSNRISIAKKGRAPKNWEATQNMGRMAQAKSVINEYTKEVFPSISHAAFSIGMKPGYLRRQLSGIRKNNTPFKYV